MTWQTIITDFVFIEKNVCLLLTNFCNNFDFSIFSLEIIEVSKPSLVLNHLPSHRLERPTFYFCHYREEESGGQKGGTAP